MSRIKVPERQLRLEAGRPAVLLFHAYTGSTADVRLLAIALQRAGFSAYAFTFAGHGTLSPSDILTKGSVEKWQRQSEEAVGLMKQKFANDFFIFGLSLGGMFAMKILEDFPELLGGGVFGSPIIRSTTKTAVTLPTGFMRYAKAVQQFNETKDIIAKKQELALIREKLPAQLQTISDFQQRVAANLVKIHQPIFIGQGGQDEIVEAKDAMLLRNALTNSGQVDYHVYPQASHVLTTNSAHKQLTADVIKFIKDNNHEVY